MVKVLLPLLALALVAASPRCGVPAASSAGEFGLYRGAPSPSEVVTISGNVLIVGQGLGDRMFTTVESRYDARTLVLLSSKRHADCCGRYWNSTIRQNSDGSYDLEALTVPGPDSAEYKERISHFRAQENVPIIVGGLFFIPWLRHATHANRIAHVEFDPLRVLYLTISDALPSPYPYSVPTGDRALRVTGEKQSTLLWYDPCTFKLDAYGDYDHAVVRSALLR